MPFGIILQMCCLNAGIGQGYHSDNFSIVVIEHPTISLTEQISFIRYGIVGKKIIQIIITTTEWCAMKKDVIVPF